MTSFISKQNLDNFLPNATYPELRPSLPADLSTPLRSPALNIDGSLTNCVKFHRTGDMAKMWHIWRKRPGEAQQDAILLAGPYFPSQSLIWIQFHCMECQRWFPRFHFSTLAHWSSPWYQKYWLYTVPEAARDAVHFHIHILNKVQTSNYLFMYFS